jgi:hypothetical protein
MGAGGTQAYKHITEHPRYPVKIEYALIDKCISSYDAPLSRTSFKKKRDACINAVEEIQNEVPFSEFERDQKVFMEVFAIYAKILE